MNQNSNIRLFKEDSPKDLAIRGFSREYILDKTGFDIGYRNSNIRGIFKTLNKHDYQVAYVRNKFSDDELISIIKSCPSKSDFLNSLCLGDVRANISKIFTDLGLRSEYRQIQNKLKSERLEQVMLNKYGVTHAMKLDKIKQKTAETNISRYGTKCTLQNKDAHAKAKNTLLQNYGVKNSMQCHEVRTKAINTCIEKYGVENPMQNDEIKNRFVETMKERYGVAYGMQSDEIKAKNRRSTEKHFGVPYPMQSPVVREKSRKTMQERYGVNYSLESKELRKKSKQTCVNKYGVENVMQNDEIKAKQQETLQKHYGVKHPTQSHEIMEKAKYTCYNNYGVENPMQSPVVREKSRKTMQERYGVNYSLESKELREKAKQTCRDKYGAENPMQNDEIKAKVVKTKHENHTFNTSKSEDLLYKLLISVFGKDDVLRQYHDDRYPFCCDFYIKSRDMFIELNAFWSHGGHWFDENKDKKTFLDWQEKSINYKSYENMLQVWTSSDIKKREYARIHELNYIVFWNTNLADAKSWFKLNCPDGTDWQHEYSWIP